LVNQNNDEIVTRLYFLVFIIFTDYFGLPEVAKVFSVCCDAKVEGSLGSMGIKLSKIIQNYRFDLRTSTQYLCMNPLSKQLFCNSALGCVFPLSAGENFSQGGSEFFKCAALNRCGSFFLGFMALSLTYNTHGGAHCLIMYTQ
jgi:hypothetical protein